MIADAMRAAYHEEVRYLCAARYLPHGITSAAGLVELRQRSAEAESEEEPVKLNPLCGSIEGACRILRFEIDRDHEVDLLEWLHKTGQLRAMPWELKGPYQFMGVDVYLVPNLPAPGWRIINPMRK